MAGGLALSKKPPCGEYFWRFVWRVHDGPNDIPRGVPQGSVLRLTHFLTFNNDLEHGLCNPCG